ncbi:hypothetical protein Efla_000448 [Eimeria flavescens]
MGRSTLTGVCAAVALPIIFSEQTADAFKTVKAPAALFNSAFGDLASMVELLWGGTYSRIEGTQTADGTMEYPFGGEDHHQAAGLAEENGCAAANMQASAAASGRLFLVVDVENANTCQELCRESSDCKAAVFDTEALTCDLLKAVNGIFPNSGTTVVLPSCDSSCFKRGQTLTGGGASLGAAPDANMCQLLCSLTAGCQAFSWKKGTKQCTSFQKEDASSTADAGAVSGPVASCEATRPVAEYKGSCSIDGLTGSQFSTLAHYSNVGSYDACRRLCLKNPKCNWLTYNTVTQKCYLKPQRGILESVKAGDVTGPKLCDGSCFVRGLALKGTKLRTITNSQSAHFCHYECSMLEASSAAASSLSWLVRSVKRAHSEYRAVNATTEIGAQRASGNGAEVAGCKPRGGLEFIFSDPLCSATTQPAEGPQCKARGSCLSLCKQQQNQKEQQQQQHWKDCLIDVLCIWKTGVCDTIVLVVERAEW